jgi:hypothetical protein
MSEGSPCTLSNEISSIIDAALFCRFFPDWIREDGVSSTAMMRDNKLAISSLSACSTAWHVSREV